MISALINGELKIEYPEGFEVMSAAELQQAFGKNDGCVWGARDVERHIVFQVLWHKSGGFLSKAADLHSIVESDEAKAAKAYKRAGFAYSLRGYFPATACGEDAKGFVYDFAKDGVEQVGVAVDFKHGNIVYKLNYYTRKQLDEENRAVFEEVLAALAF